MKHVITAAAILLILPGPSRSADASERIAPNDNTKTAGSVANGVLTIHLEARSGVWHPDGDDEPGVRVSAFGVEGGPLQVYESGRASRRRCGRASKERPCARPAFRPLLRSQRTMFAFPRGKRTPAGFETQAVSGRLSEPAARKPPKTPRFQGRPA